VAYLLLKGLITTYFKMNLNQLAVYWNI